MRNPRETASSSGDWWNDPGKPAITKTPRPAQPKPTPTPTPQVAARTLPLFAVLGGLAAVLLVAGTLVFLLIPRSKPSTSVFTGEEEPLAPPAYLLTKPRVLPMTNPDEPELLGEPRTETPVVALKPAIVEVVPKIARPTPTRLPLVVVRRSERTEDDLLREIAKVTELTLDRTAARNESSVLISAANTASRTGRPAESTVQILEKRTDLQGIPWRKGEACKLTPTTADHLQSGSVALRGMLFQATQSGLVRRGGGSAATETKGPEALHKLLMDDSKLYNKWLNSEAVPALLQLLMAENESIREVLVDQLAAISGKAASEALAQRALYDLHPRVRERALLALEKRPVAEYSETLLKGFHHPWPAVAEHAAEAIAALKLTGLIPTMLAILDAPAPHQPQDKPGVGKVIKEMVRINHLRNCLMCHAASTSADDKVRGFVPPPTQALPPAFSREYYAPKQTGVFVRADVTYIKQDFSMPLAVKNPGVWPATQRFDFVVRERKATEAEITKWEEVGSKQPSEQQKALFFALRQLTGKDPGPTAEDWKRFFINRTLELKTWHTGFTAARAIAVDTSGKAYVRDGKRIWIKDGDGRPTAWIEDEESTAGLAFDAKGQLLAAQGGLSEVARFDPATKESKTLAMRYEGRRLHHPRRVVGDALGGVYFTDEAAKDDRRDSGAVYYVSPHGTLSKLAVTFARPRALALSNDGKVLYIASATTPDVLACTLESAGSVLRSKPLGRLASEGTTAGAATDMAVSANGLVCVLNTSTQSVEIFGPTGGKLGRASVPEKPIACTFGGKDRKTLYVLTRTGLYTLELSGDPLTLVASR